MGALSVRRASLLRGSTPGILARRLPKIQLWGVRSARGAASNSWGAP
jgi:hypothetical protein